jgi:hypothetical protein
MDGRHALPAHCNESSSKGITSWCVLFLFLSVTTGVAQGKQLNRQRIADALLVIVDIPIDIGIAGGRPFDPDRVADAIRRLDEFTTDEISQAVDEYWQRRTSDEPFDKMAKLYLINGYVFKNPRSAKIDDELGAAGVGYFQTPRNGVMNLQQPWEVRPNGEYHLTVSNLSTEVVSGTGYHGPELFKIFSKRFERRLTTKEGRSGVIHEQ